MDEFVKGLRKNIFFHKEFNPNLGNSESKALYSNLYNIEDKSNSEL
jgi:hypothetical protein